MYASALSLLSLLLVLVIMGYGTALMVGGPNLANKYIRSVIKKIIDLLSWIIQTFFGMLKWICKRPFQNKQKQKKKKQKETEYIPRRK